MPTTGEKIGRDNPAFSSIAVSDSHNSEVQATEPNRFSKGGTCASRTTLEKVLIVLLLVFLAALIAVVIALIVEKNDDDSHSSSTSKLQGSDVCITKECVAAAARINSYIDYNVAPCEDLYGFACGRWMRENVIPEDKSSYNTFSELRDQVDIVLKSLLEEEHHDTDKVYVTKAKNLYASCMNMDLINQRADAPLKEFLESKFGGWPLTRSGWAESTFNLTNLMIQLNKYSGYPVIALYVDVDSKNSSKRVLNINQPSFGMPGQKYYKVPRNDSMLKAYENLIYGIGKLLGFANPSTAKEEVAAMVDFEIRLADISVPDEERRDSNALYNPMTLAQVQGNYSEIMDWRRYVLRSLSLPEVGVRDVTDDELIINESPLYYQRLIEVLKTTPKKTLANYMIWHIVMSLAETQGDEYKDLYIDYRQALYGLTSVNPRFKTCTGLTTALLGLGVGRMFIKDNFDADAKTMALDMIKDLQSSFNELVEGLDWMDEHTKKVAREKNEFIQPKIGYPEEVMNDTYLEQKYANETYYPDKYFENLIMGRLEGFYESMRQLREPVDRDLWTSPPSTVNAFYSAARNQIMFPAGILQPPFFSKTYPHSLNYGGIGVVIGHEITHGFDDRGRQYDKNGNLVQWWSDSAIEKFKAKAQCIVEQYGNFTVTGANMKLNGVNTQGENIADNGGLKQAFRAYRNWVRRQGKEEPPLPGLGFSHNQLFFINFAQLWCNLMRDQDVISRIRTGVHSPGQFRVIGSVQNSPDFSDAFKCQPNSGMNPQRKCTVW